MYYVYVLVSETTGKRYIGQTDNIERRRAEHNDPKHNPRKHTSRNTGPWRLIYQEPFESRTEAVRREKWLKSGRGRHGLNEKIGRASRPQGE